MGCAPSKQEAPNTAQDGPAQRAGASASARLNRALSNTVAFPGSFFEREEHFRKEPDPRRVVPERREGPCRLRVGAWGAWKDGWALLAGHELRFHAGAGGPPPPGAAPERSLELVGARLRAEHRQELALSPPGGGPPAVLAFPDGRQRDEWMVGLGQVPGLFRRVGDYYQVGASWGRGATCVVHECVARFSGRRLALKSRVDAGSREASRAMHNELRVLQICARQPHPAIPRLHDYFFDEQGAIELVIDLMEGGELFDHIAAAERLSEREACNIFRQVVEGVAHLHSLGIAHRDLKPQNLMYTSADQGSQVCITDYDLARVNHAPAWEGSTPCGTLHYMAPEIVQQQRYSLAVDVWSLGVILYILLTGRMPFDGKDAESIAAAIEAGRYSMAPQLWGGISEAAQDLVRSLLQADPTQRPTAQQMLLHPWLTAPLEGGGASHLPSPSQLRKTLSETKEGRQRLAAAAMVCSEGDLRQLRRAAATTSGLANRRPFMQLGGASPWDFDMRPVRAQAESPRASGSRRSPQNGRSAAAAGLAAGSRQGARLALLRTQLGVIGTAAGLQDGQALQLAGQELLGGSPRAGSQEAESPGRGGRAPVADWWLPPQHQQQLQRRRGQQQTAASAPGVVEPDSFADLPAVQVQEQDLLPGSAATSRRGSFSFNHQGESLRLGPAGDGKPQDSSSHCDRCDNSGDGQLCESFGSYLSAGAQLSRELSREVVLNLAGQPQRLPAAMPREQQQHHHHQQQEQQQQEQLPDDAELLQRLAGGPPQQSGRLEHGQRSDAAVAEAAHWGPGLGRSQSAVPGSSWYGSEQLPPRIAPARSVSSSRLQVKDLRLGPEEREPVDLAMRSKRQRLQQLAASPPARLQP